MHPSSSSVMSVPRPDSARYSNDSDFSDDDAGIFMTIDSERGTEFFAAEPPRAGLASDYYSPQKEEKQISVDPISLQGSSTTLRHASFRLVSPPTNPGLGSGPIIDPSSLPLPPPKLKFVSASLPSSTSSSPESVLSNNKKKSHKKHDKVSRMRSHVMDDTQLAMVEANTRKSKSLGEGRTSGHADDFDLWLEKSSNQNTRKDQSHNTNTNTNTGNKLGGFSKPPLVPNNNAYRNSSSTIRKSRTTREDSNLSDDRFKCGKLCLFLPRGGKGKTVRSISSTSTISQVSYKTEPLAISRRASMEKFDCGSWASPSSTSLDSEEGGESTSLFFDLPMELLRCSVSDMQSPVTAAFVFDNGEDNSEDTKDKDTEVIDFHAFLEAQS